MDNLDLELCRNIDFRYRLLAIRYKNLKEDIQQVRNTLETELLSDITVDNIEIPVNIHELINMVLYMPGRSGYQNAEKGFQRKS